MVRTCCAWYCSNRDVKLYRDPPLNIQFFPFPKHNVGLRKKWQVAVSSGRRDHFLPNDKTVVCSVHFEKTEFEPPKNKKSPKTLRPDAVPTLFFIPSYEEELEMKFSDEGSKPKVPSIQVKQPRRLRKIYVDERNYIDERGQSKRSYTFFVLPFAFTGGAPVKPDFDNPLDDETSNLPEAQKKGVTVAVVHSDGFTSIAKPDPDGNFSIEQDKPLNAYASFPKSMPLSKKKAAAKKWGLANQPSDGGSGLVKIVFSEDNEGGDNEHSSQKSNNSGMYKSAEDRLKFGGDDYMEPSGGRDSTKILVAIPAMYKGRVNDFINSQDFKELVQKKKVIEFWKKVCCTSSDEDLGFAGEYEDHDVIPRRIPKRPFEHPILDLKDFKRRKLDQEEEKYRQIFDLQDLSVGLLPVNQQVTREGASRYQKDLFLIHRVTRDPRPKKTFFYDKGEDFDIPMNPVAISYESDSKKRLVKKHEYYSPIPMSGLRSTRRSKGALSLQHQQHNKAVDKTRPDTIVKDEHNYITDSAVTDSNGRLVYTDPKIAKQQEKVNELRKTIKDLKRKIHRKDMAFNKLLSQVKNKKSKPVSPFENVNVHPVVKELFSCELKNVELRGKKTRRYTENVKEFCHSIYKISPKAYKFMRGFFNLPNQARIRAYKPNAFSMPAELPPIMSDTIDESSMGGSLANGLHLPTEPLPPMDLEMNDLMYDLDQDSNDGQPEPYVPESDDDDYEKCVLENPPLVVSEEPSMSNRVIDHRPLNDPSRMMAKRRTISKRPGGKKQKADDDDDEEETIATPSAPHFPEGLVQAQQWIKKPIPQYHPPTATPQVYSLYANPQPGTSSTGQPIPGATMPDVYMCPESLKSFDPYYF